MALDIVVLSRLTLLFSVAWLSVTVPMKWKTGPMVFKNGNRRVCSNYQGITQLGLHEIIYCRVLERRLHLIIGPIQEEQ